jgi:hypothetical protein
MSTNHSGFHEEDTNGEILDGFLGPMLLILLWLLGVPRSLIIILFLLGVGH